ncbi:hypothetical protein HK097_007046 [Rhizophlyctis rosea]|uniref:Uncharacterized protein n=1 Tax=Rhizophlyctis rosea TaxID=64517 RepID=A0AAD5SF56_9FUNG|nr:hypothetical protein HK097_007046 [Rhizophlyctis rosea]
MAEMRGEVVEQEGQEVQDSSDPVQEGEAEGVQEDEVGIVKEEQDDEDQVAGELEEEDGEKDNADREDKLEGPDSDPPKVFRRSPIKDLRSPVVLETGEMVPPIVLRLGEAQLVYEGHEWRVDNGDIDDIMNHASSRKGVVADLEERNRRLEGENEALKMKVDVLLDMLAVTKLDTLQLQEKLREE